MRQKVTSINDQPCDLHVLWSASDQPSINRLGILVAVIDKTLRQLSNWHDALERRNGEANHFRFGACHTKIDNVAKASAASVRRFDGAHDDVLRAQIFDLFLCFAADPLTDGQQPNHASDANKYPQHRQC